MHCLMYSLFFYCYAVLDIVVCVDMVEPSRIATLLGKWSHFLARNICIVLSYVVLFFFSGIWVTNISV